MQGTRRRDDSGCLALGSIGRSATHHQFWASTFSLAALKSSALVAGIL